jgi:hypothetical protein
MWIVDADVDCGFIKMCISEIPNLNKVTKSYAGCLSTGLI